MSELDALRVIVVQQADEIERLKAIHEVNADTLNAMQVEIEQRDAVIERKDAALRSVMEDIEDYSYTPNGQVKAAIKEALAVL